MKKMMKRLLLAIAIFFSAVLAAQAQSHNYKASEGCRLGKITPGAAMNEGKFCPACRKENEEEKVAKQAFDKQQTEKAQAKARVEAQQKAVEAKKAEMARKEAAAGSHIEYAAPKMAPAPKYSYANGEVVTFSEKLENDNNNWRYGLMVNDVEQFSTINYVAEYGPKLLAVKMGNAPLYSFRRNANVRMVNQKILVDIKGKVASFDKESFFQDVYSLKDVDWAQEKREHEKHIMKPPYLSMLKPGYDKGYAYAVVVLKEILTKGDLKLDHPIRGYYTDKQAIKDAISEREDDRYMEYRVISPWGYLLLRGNTCIFKIKIIYLHADLRVAEIKYAVEAINGSAYGEDKWEPESGCKIDYNTAPLR